MQTKFQKKFMVLTICALAFPTAAFAQAPPAPNTPPAQTAPPNISRNQNCAPTQATPRDGSITPQDGSSTTGQSSEPLSDKLAKSDGVLCPPAGIDSEMHAPTPGGGNTPVIPPPGSPGGDPNVVPK